MAEERPLTRRQRLLVLALVWVVGVPFSVGLWLVLRWIGVAIVAGAVWASWDYYRRGGMIDSVDRVGRAGRFLTDAFDDEEPGR